MSKEQKITGNIQPPKKDLEILKQNFPHCFDKSDNFDFEKFKKQLSEKEINFSKESYSMDWLGKSYARLLATDETTTLLKEDETFNQKDENKNSENLLIKGDNLEVLKHLSNAYYEKIKMIYIDPPYNTGSDGFVYADDRKFDVPTLMELAGVSEERAKRILDFTQSKSNSHSAWLTFMYPRLYIAKQLLKEDGVIFISIDDNEVAQLRLLMDEVFGEDNFRGDIIRATGTTTGQTANQVGSSYDTLLCYSKTDSFDFGGISLKGKDLNRFNNDDNDGNGKYALLQLRKTGNADRKEDRKGMFFPIKAPDETNVYPIGPTNYLSRWRVGKKTYNAMITENLVVWKKEDEKDIQEVIIDKEKYKSVWKPYVKYYLEGRTKKVSNLWSDIDGNKKGSIEIKSLFGFAAFSNPKPIDFLRRIIEVSDIFTEDIILDFFAGSGTTGEAVMQLNAEDTSTSSITTSTSSITTSTSSVQGGNRKFILVQLPELIDPKSNKTAYDFVKDELKVEEPSIFDITKERLIRASKKIQEELQENKNLFSEDNKNNQIDLGFKVFETMPIWEDYNFEADELDNQLSLFDESKLTKEDIKALLVTWKTYDGISLTETIQETDLKGYTAHYSSEKLYLMDKGFKTENLKALLEKIDSDKNFNPTTIIAFGYHFESKNLREISENIKSYANKKSIDIDFITRY